MVFGVCTGVIPTYCLCTPPPHRNHQFDFHSRSNDRAAEGAQLRLARLPVVSAPAGTTPAEVSVRPEAWRSANLASCPRPLSRVQVSCASAARSGPPYACAPMQIHGALSPSIRVALNCPKKGRISRGPVFENLKREQAQDQNLSHSCPGTLSHLSRTGSPCSPGASDHCLHRPRPGHLVFSAPRAQHRQSGTDIGFQSLARLDPGWVGDQLGRYQPHSPRRE